MTVHGTKKQAQEKLTELVGQVQHNEYIEPSKMTVGQYLDEWLATAIKPSAQAVDFNKDQNALFMSFLLGLRRRLVEFG